MASEMHDIPRSQWPEDVGSCSRWQLMVSVSKQRGMLMHRPVRAAAKALDSRWGT
eukprot:CAMPEP_0174372002 /NCGR_PEP_ID=MMETSP0811_2-20130205/101888_1 /TAXON_ID=73025 ORGANISM="Eutreptiella gymnastica-like, Strain CCMP1594" /NCGR_SAMPLE_ID=MMETSP0811_2 /ASSEMBLY_ACC=CAM_ASM_000667 /LENGTH=54 /DNA_ID=CAMNT_0015518953 /DNA_START=428 /DNA_END=592 /DNA_ORIENTATION=+